MADGATSGQHDSEPVERATALRVGLDDAEDSGVAENAPTGLPASDKPRSKGGRPRGSKNKVHRDSHILIEAVTPGIIAEVEREQRLGYYWKQLKGGAREKVYLTAGEIMERRRFIVERNRSVPIVKAVETNATINQTTTDLTPQHDSRQTARAVLSILREGVEGGGKVHVASPDETLLRVPKRMAGYVGGEEITGGDSSASGDGEAGEVEAPASPVSSIEELRLGDVEPIAGDRVYAQVVRGPTGLAWTVVANGVMGEAQFATRTEAREAARRQAGMARMAAGGDARPDERASFPRRQPRVILGHASAKGNGYGR